jgi:hypothetical protein
MKSKKILSWVVICAFIISAVAVPTITAKVDDKEKIFSYLAPIDDKFSGRPVKASASVDFRNIAAGDTLFSEVEVVAQATGTAVSVVYVVDGQTTENLMSRVSSSDRYVAQWDTSKLSTAIPHSLTLKAKDSQNNVVATSSISVTVAGALRYNIRYEVDYMANCYPDQSVFDYLTDYWADHAVKVTFTKGNVVQDPTAADKVITDSDFWFIENNNNAGPDNSADNGYQYFLEDKWMLCGTFDTNINVGGYTYVPRTGRDYVGGNYIFIAQSMIADWEEANSILDFGGSVIVVGHEAGHSVGIVVGGSEKYDPDYYSIMSYMRMQNAKDMVGNWYYSKEYWAAANFADQKSLPSVI